MDFFHFGLKHKKKKKKKKKTPTPKKKKKKKTIPDIFCDYVLVFQRQVEQLIQRRHGCDETKRDTEMMKIEREGERWEAKKLFSFAGSATAQTANAEKKPNNNQGRR